MKTRRRLGFTLVELIAVIVIVASALAVFTLALNNNSEERERKIVLGEARNLCAWFKSKFSLAAREGNDWKVTVGTIVGSSKGKSITIQRKISTYPFKVEEFEFQNAKLEYSGNSELIFSGKWYTLTPAATFIVKSKTYTKISYNVVISEAGYIHIE